MVSHAANPCAVPLTSDIVRVYFTSRDHNNRSHVSFVDLDSANGYKVLEICKKPVITPGGPGYFDDSGAAMGCYIQHQGKRLIYYLGWNLKVTVPWQNSIGLAVSNEHSDEFIKHSSAPIVDRNNDDPFSISYPFVLYEGQKFKMWYGSNLNWGPDQDQMNHVLKYAESTDGIQWNRTNQICIGLQSDQEYAISKPCVIKFMGKYCMWYSHRSKGNVAGYRIGYAESQDGIQWERKDQLAGIAVSKSGWDSEMICYPFVFQHHNKFVMLYNGNKYGKTGFGLAIAENF